MDKNNIDITKLSRVQKVIDAVKRTVTEEDPDVTFEYIVGSCFPTVFENVQKKLRDEHMEGYLEGLAASKDLTIEQICDMIKEKGE